MNWLPFKVILNADPDDPLLSLRSVVYAFRSKVSGKMYVGKTKRKFFDRLKGHISASNSGSAFAIHKAISKYGIENFEFSILDHIEPERLIEVEMSRIREFGTFENGYNMSLGGEGPIGWKPSEKTRQKIRASKKGKPCLVKEKLKKKVETYDPETDETIREFESISEASVLTSNPISNISSACHGKLMTCGGLHWRFCNQRDRKRGKWADSVKAKAVDRIRASSKKRIKAVEQIDLETGEVIAKYESFKKAY